MYFQNLSTYIFFVRLISKTMYTERQTVVDNQKSCTQTFPRLIPHQRLLLFPWARNFNLIT